MITDYSNFTDTYDDGFRCNCWGFSGDCRCNNRATGEDKYCDACRVKMGCARKDAERRQNANDSAASQYSRKIEISSL